MKSRSSWFRGYPAFRVAKSCPKDNSLGRGGCHFIGRNSKTRMAKRGLGDYTLNVCRECHDFFALTSNVFCVESLIF
jgi:hypothetical protein